MEKTKPKPFLLPFIIWFQEKSSDHISVHRNKKAQKQEELWGRRKRRKRLAGKTLGERSKANNGESSWTSIMKLSLAKAVIVTGKKVELNDPSNKCLQQLEHISISNLLFVRFSAVVLLFSPRFRRCLKRREHLQSKLKAFKGIGWKFYADKSGVGRNASLFSVSMGFS